MAATVSVRVCERMKSSSIGRPHPSRERRERTPAARFHRGRCLRPCSPGRPDTRSSHTRRRATGISPPVECLPNEWSTFVALLQVWGVGGVSGPYGLTGWTSEVMAPRIPAKTCRSEEQILSLIGAAFLALALIDFLRTDVSVVEAERGAPPHVGSFAWERTRRRGRPGGRGGPRPPGQGGATRPLRLSAAWPARRRSRRSPWRCSGPAPWCSRRPRRPCSSRRSRIKPACPLSSTVPSCWRSTLLMPPLMCPVTAPPPRPRPCRCQDRFPKVAAAAPMASPSQRIVPRGRLVLVGDLDLAVGPALEDRGIELIPDPRVRVQRLHGLVVDLGVRNAVVGPSEDQQRVLLAHHVPSLSMPDPAREGLLKDLSRGCSR